MTSFSGKPFPLRVRHFEHEPAHSLLLRTAEHNGTSLFSSMFKRFGIDHGRSVHNIDPAVVAFACGADPKAVQLATANLGGAEIQLLGQTLSREHWAGHFRRWCPLCLDEAPFHRAWWDLGVITACTVHDVELVSRCDCDRPMLHGQHAILRCRNQHDLAAVETTPVDPAELAAEKYIVSRLTSAPALAVPVMDDVTLDAAISAMEYMGKLRLGATGNIFHARKRVGRRRLINTGFAVLSDFPRSFDGLLDDLVADRLPKPRGRNVWGVAHAYGDLSSWLLNRVRQNSKDLLSRSLRDSLDEHAKANVLLKTGYVAGGEIVLGTPLRDVADRCGMGFEVFVRITQKLGLISVHRSKGRPHRVTRDQAEAIVERLSNMVSMERACDQLGVASERVIELVDSGLLTCVDRPYDRSNPTGKRGDPVTALLRDRPSNRWLFDPDVVPAFLARLETLVPLGKPDAYGDLMPASSSGVLYTSVLRCVELILEGKLAIRGVDDNAAGLSRLLVSRSEAAEAFKLDRRGGHLALRDAAPLMGLNYNQLRGCVLAGLVTPLGSGKATYLTAELVQQFRQTYIRATEIAEIFGAGGSRVAIRYLKEAGLEPVGGKGDLGVTLYLREIAEPVVRGLPAPEVFASTRERARYQRERGLEVASTRRERRTHEQA